MSEQFKSTLINHVIWGKNLMLTRMIQSKAICQFVVFKGPSYPQCWSSLQKKKWWLMPVRS